MFNRQPHRRLAFFSLLGAIASSFHVAHAQLSFDPQRKEQLLFIGQVQVAAGRQYIKSFTTLTNFVNGRIAGNVQAGGGSGNDIRVVVAKGKSMIYDSGRRRSVVLSVDISEPGQYTLIFDNGFSLVSGKVVTGRISLVHWGMDTQKNVADQQAASEQQGQGKRILQRLYTALKANEKVWGTTQLFGLPTLRLNNDQTINAGAIWSANLIQINKGTFEFADRAGDKNDDILAAILAHELAHIFYRHPGYGSGYGVKGFFDTELDRQQEKEADLLGIRVACQAKFDPEGVLLVMRKFAELDGAANSFMRNHPTGVERSHYLQGEVARCQALQRQQQPNAAPTVTTVANETAVENTAATSDSSSDQAVWKLIQSPNVAWKFKVGDQFVYGERTLPEERRKRGDYDTVDEKKQGVTYSGNQRVRVTFKPGFHYQGVPLGLGRTVDFGNR